MKKLDKTLILNLIIASKQDSIEVMEKAYNQYQNLYSRYYGYESDFAKFQLLKFQLRTKKN